MLCLQKEKVFFDEIVSIVMNVAETSVIKVDRRCMNTHEIPKTLVTKNGDGKQNVLHVCKKSFKCKFHRP